MNETEEALSSCIEEVLKKSDAVQCCTTEQRNVLINENDEIIESCSNVVVNKSNDVKSTNPEGSVEIKGSSCRVRTSSEHHIATEDVMIDTSALAHPKTEISDINGSFLHEDAGAEQTSKSADETQLRRPASSQAHESTKNTGWIFQGEHNGYVYYTDNSGQVYSVDRSGYWYIQQENGDFVPYDSSLHYVNIQLQMFPLNDGGQPTLPSNAQGEKVFPTDANHMPIFPLDPKTNQPTFPVDDIGQPVFPSGVNGRAIVPVDSNGVAIFPRGENGRFIFPSGANGNPVAPVNIYGVPVLPLDSNGKPVIPYDSNGAPLIHLANDGVTPLTEEEYQYSLQWNDYYDKYSQYYNQQNASQQGSTGVIVATSAETLEQHEKNLKLLKKVRPEDIDLPPSEPPPVTGPVPVSMTPVSAIPRQEPPKNDEKSEAEMQLKAKTKRLLEMQLRFTRKATFGGGRANPSKTTKGNDSTSDTADGSSEAGAAASAKDEFGLQVIQPVSNVGDTDAGIETIEAMQARAVAGESVAKDGSVKSVPDRASSTERCSNQHQLGRDGENDLISLESSKVKQVLESSRDESAVTRDVAVRGERGATKSMENDSADASRNDPGVEETVRGQDSSRKIVHMANSEIVKSPASNADSARDVDSSFSKPRSRKDDSNKENERRYSRSSSEERPRNIRRSSSRRRRSSSRNNLDSIDHERLYSERSYRSSRWRDSRSRSDSYSPRYRSRSPPRRRLSSFRRSRSSPRYSSRSPDRSRDRYSRRERSSSRTRRYIRERSTKRRGRSYTSSSRSSFYSSRSSRCWSSSRERSPYRGRSSYRSHWERSSSRRRSRSPGYLSPRRSDDNGRSYSRDRWSRRRSRNRSLHRSSRSTSRPRGRAASRTSPTSCSPSSVNDSGKGTAVRSTTSDESRCNDSAKGATKRSVKSNESRSASPIPLPSDLTSVRSDVSSKLKSSTKTITSYSEKSLTERSESEGQVVKAKRSKEKKKKKKRDRKGSSSRKSKEDSAKVHDDERATEATPSKESDSRLDASETEPLEFDSYGPLPPKKMLNDAESETNEVADCAKNAKSAKDKETKRKKKKKRKKRSKGSNSEHEEDMRENSHHEPEAGEAEVDGIEPGEIREQDPSPKSYVDESDGLSVVFIGPKWEGIAKNSATAKLTDDGVHKANDAPPKVFYTKFIRETISSPIVTFTSNPTMAESFMKLKQEFDAADGPRRSVQASKHFQAAMEILNESSVEQCDPVDETAAVAPLTSKHLTPKAFELDKNESTTDNKWKSLEETTKERREKKKAKKEKKLKRAIEREKKMSTGEKLTTSITEEGDAETTTHAKGNGVKAEHGEQVGKELPRNANEFITKEFKIATGKKVVGVLLSGSGVAAVNESEISMGENKAAAVGILEAVSESLQPSVVYPGSVVETDTTISTELGTCDTQPSTDAGSVNESPSAISLKSTMILPQLDNQTESCVTDVAVASTSGKGEKGTQADDETRRRKEIMKRKLEEEEEDELSRLRYEALRSKTRRLMNDLRMERRRLKRERLRATLAMRRVRGYDDDISVDDLLMVDSSETSDTDDSNASNRASMKSTKRRLIKRARTSGDGSWRYNRYKSLNIHDDEIHDLRMQTIEESMPTTNTVITCKSPPIIDGSSQNDLISELQNRIGGTNKGALQLLEQLRRSLATSRGANIHLNPDMILNSP